MKQEMKGMKGIVSLWAALVCVATGVAAQPLEPADTLYFGGPVITIDDSQPQAEAVAVKGGKILAVGDLDVLKRGHLGEGTELVDLAGHTLLPGFIDSHGHAYLTGFQATVANLLPPPDGAAKGIGDLQQTLKAWSEARSEIVGKIGWIMGFGYDDSQLMEQRHPTRDDLDLVSTTLPVIAIHQSGHLGAVNSKALALAGVSAETPDPSGGVFRRRAGSQEPDGVLEEKALIYLFSKLAANFDHRFNEVLVEEGAKLLASYGFTTAQEGNAMPDWLAAIQRVADSEGLMIDLVAYPNVLYGLEFEPSLTYDNGYRIGGVKLTLDGSPQGKTAWLSQPYKVPPQGQERDYRGYAGLEDPVARQAVESAFANDWQILIHANGDAAIDQLIESVRLAQAKYPDVDNRPVLIHGQTLREDQVDRLKQQGIFPSLFPMHTFYWGDWHRDSVLGPERANNISPTGWLMARDMPFGTHHDAPVVLPDAMRVLSATVTRKTRSGRVLGAQHRVPVATALKAMTLWPAWQHFEETRKGSIEVGKLADLVILSANPLTTPEEQIAGIRVLETIKAGRTIYRRDAGDSLPPPALGGAGHAPQDLGEAPGGAHADGKLNPFVALFLAALDRAEAERSAASEPQAH